MSSVFGWSWSPLGIGKPWWGEWTDSKMHGFYWYVRDMCLLGSCDTIMSQINSIFLYWDHLKSLQEPLLFQNVPSLFLKRNLKQLLTYLDWTSWVVEWMKYAVELNRFWNTQSVGNLFKLPLQKQFDGSETLKLLIFFNCFIIMACMHTNTHTHTV